MINLFLGLLNLTNRRKVNNFRIKHYKKWRIYKKYLDGSKLSNIGSAVIIKISKNNLNRLLFLKASFFSSSSKSSPSSDSTTQTITSRHLLLFVFEIIFYSCFGKIGLGKLKLKWVNRPIMGGSS